MKQANRWATLFTLVSVCAAAQGPGPGAGGHGHGPQGGREWPGLRRHDCGADLHVVDVEGHERVFWPPETLLKEFETVDINQGEEPRRALALTVLLSRYNANAVEVAGCGDDRRRFSADDAKSAMLVLTRRGLFKIVRKDGKLGYVNVLPELKEMKFEAAPKPPPSP